MDRARQGDARLGAGRQKFHRARSDPADGALTTSWPAACCCRMRGCRASSLSAISGHGNRMTENPPLWKANVVLAKELAADVAAVLELSPPAPQAVLIAEEPFKDEATVEALYAEMPDGELLSQARGARGASSRPCPIRTGSSSRQEGLPPVRAGRFFVYGAHDAGKVPPGVIPMRIEAGMAFGTGHHETTALCLGRAERSRQAAALSQRAGSGLRHGAARHRRGQAVAAAVHGLRHRSRGGRGHARECARPTAKRRWSARWWPTG